MSTATIAALLLLAGSQQPASDGPIPQATSATQAEPAAASAPVPTPPSGPVASPVAQSQPAGQAAATPAGQAAPSTAAVVPASGAQAASPSQPAPPPVPDAEPEESAIVVTARQKVASDPAEAINLKTFEVVDAADRAVVAPLAKGYEKGLPKPVRSGLHNFLSNLTEPVVFVNFLLQLKPGKAAETLGRFALNSTVGVAGLVDVAKNKPFHLPHRNNGFADTLGYYGVGPGPYIYLPLIGPSTVRDLFGWVLDKSFLPAIAGAPFSKPVFAFGTGAVKSLDDRVEFDSKIEEFRETGDSYSAERDYYLNLRQAEIDGLRGRKPAPPKPAQPAVTPAPAPLAAPAMPATAQPPATAPVSATAPVPVTPPAAAPATPSVPATPPASPPSP